MKNTQFSYIDQKYSVFRIQLRSFWYKYKVFTTFLEKVGIFQIRKWAWTKPGLAIGAENKAVLKIVL